MDLYNSISVVTMDNICDAREQYTIELAAILYHEAFMKTISSDIYDTNNEYYHILCADLKTEAMNSARGISYYKYVKMLKIISSVDIRAFTIIIDHVEHHSNDIFSVDTFNLLIDNINRYKSLCGTSDNIEDVIKFMKDPTNF